MKDIFISRDAAQPLVYSFMDVSCDGLMMIAFFVDVYWAIIRLHKWHIQPSPQIQSYIQEVDNLGVHFNGDGKAVLLVDSADVFLYQVSLLKRLPLFSVAFLI